MNKGPTMRLNFLKAKHSSLALLSLALLTASAVATLFVGTALAQAPADFSAAKPQVAPALAPGWARFEPSPGHQMRVARAQQETAHRDALRRYYEAIGYDYAHPVINSSTFAIVVDPPVRRYSYPRTYRPVSIYPTVPMVYSERGL